MNPFEVRLDVVRMAKQMLEREHDSKMSEYQNSVHAAQHMIAVNSSSYTTNEAVTMVRSLRAPAAPTAEEVTARATTLYSFVNSKT